MTKQEKQGVIDELKVRFDEGEFFYLADSSALSVAQVNKLRRICHEKGVEFRVAKNTLIKKALEASDSVGYADLFEALKGPTAVFFSEISNMPAKVIKEFRKSADKPILKAASIEKATYLGDHQLEALASLKSKDELLGDMIFLLKSPATSVVSALQSGGHTLSGILKALEERAQ